LVLEREYEDLVLIIHTGVYRVYFILEITPPPPRGGEISEDVIWGKKYEKGKRKNKK
jgi:hypothetical protein